MTPAPTVLARALKRLIPAAAAGLLLVLIGGLTIYALSGAESPGVSIGGPFRLTGTDGRQVSEASWPGKYLLIYFGYTYCPDICPTTLTNMAGALTALGEQADRLQPLFITVDPKRDTPPALAEYTAAFGKELIGLTGDAAQISQVAKEYRVYYAEHRTGPGPNDYVMDHSSIIYLMAPDGHFVAAIPADLAPAAMAKEIAEHLS
jgi:protein SCO1/2